MCNAVQQAALLITLPATPLVYLRCGGNHKDQTSVCVAVQGKLKLSVS